LDGSARQAGRRNPLAAVAAAPVDRGRLGREIGRRSACKSSGQAQLSHYGYPSRRWANAPSAWVGGVLHGRMQPRATPPDLHPAHRTAQDHAERWVTSTPAASSPKSPETSVDPTRT